MECGKYKEQISLMIDGELDISASEALKAHLADCPECRRFHARLHALNMALGSVSCFAAGPALAERVKERLSRRKSHRFASDSVIWLKVPVMAMIILLAIGLGNLAGRSISDFITSTGLHSSAELIASDSENSLSDALLDLSAEENHQ